MSNNCSKHRKDVFGETDMKKLAEEIGNLHYETLSHLFECITDKLFLDAAKDRAGGRKKLANHLDNAGHRIYSASVDIESAWDISKPYMEKMTDTKYIN